MYFSTLTLLYVFVKSSLATPIEASTAIQGPCGISGPCGLIYDCVACPLHPLCKGSTNLLKTLQPNTLLELSPLLHISKLTRDTLLKDPADPCALTILHAPHLTARNDDDKEWLSGHYPEAGDTDVLHLIDDLLDTQAPAIAAQPFNPGPVLPDSINFESLRNEEPLLVRRESGVVTQADEFVAVNEVLKEWCLERPDCARAFAARDIADLSKGIVEHLDALREEHAHPKKRDETPTATNTAQDSMLTDPYLPTRESALTGYIFGTWFAYWIDEECKTHLDRCHWTNTWGMFNLLGEFVAELGGFNPKPKGGGE